MSEPDVMFTEAFWEERYGATESVWSGNPNAVLVAEAGDLVPGTALDIGCGEGADAVWLAERGWQVTAADFSTVALARGAEHAAARGSDVATRISWTHVDVRTWEPPAATFDLVSSQFMHLPGMQAQELFARLAAAVTPGGTLLVVGHHPSDLHTTMHRPPFPEIFFTAEDVAAGLDPEQWEIVVTDERPKDTTDQDGRAVTIHFAVLRARRRVAG